MAVADYQVAYGCDPPAYLTDTSGRPAHSWRVLLLPFLEEPELYAEYNFSEPWNGPHNRALASRMPAVYAFLGNPRTGLTETNYLAVVGPETVWPGSACVTPEDVTDGTSSTILVVENQDAGVQWLEPRDLSFRDMSFALNRPNGVSSKYLNPAVVRLDSQVQELKPTLPESTLRALLTIRGGENLERNGRDWVLLKDGRDRPLANPPPADDP